MRQGSMFSLALANQKGGVGKTTNTINIAGALADRGHRVLVVDCDPQGYLSVTLGFRDQYEDSRGLLADGLLDPAQIDPETTIQAHPEFDVIPATTQLRSVVQALGAEPSESFGMVRRFLESVSRDQYDVVLVDTPPVHNSFTDVLLADISDIFVPMEVSEPSVYSIHALVDHIVDLQQTYAAGIRIRAILLSNVSYPLDNEQRRVSEWVEENFGGQCPIYEIRSRAAIQRSLRDHSSIFGPNAETTDMRGVYEEIADQIERLHPALRGSLGEAKQ